MMSMHTSREIQAEMHCSLIKWACNKLQHRNIVITSNKWATILSQIQHISLIVMSENVIFS